MRRALVLVVLLGASAPVLAQDLYSGTWSNDEMTLTLQYNEGLFTGTFSSGVARGNIAGGINEQGLQGNYSGTRGTGLFTARLQGPNLIATWGAQATVLQRGARKSRPPGRAAPEAAEPSPSTHADPRNGWSLTAPSGWRMAGKGAEVNMVGEGDAGLIQAAFVPGLDADGAIDFLAQPHDMANGTWRAVGQPRSVPDARAVGVGGKIDGAGGSLAAHTAIVFGTRGAVVIVGYAPADGGRGIQRRVEEVARSVRFRR